MLRYDVKSSAKFGDAVLLGVGTGNQESLFGGGGIWNGSGASQRISKERHSRRF